MTDFVWYPLALLGGMAGVVGALFLHEVAHAIPVLAAGGSIHITIGSDEGRTARLGPVTLTFGIDGPRKLLAYGHYRADGVDSRAVHAVSVLAGPAVTVAIVAAVGTALSRGGSGPLFAGLWVVFGSELYRAVQTIVPKTYSRGAYAGMDSDGKRFLRLVGS